MSNSKDLAGMTLNERLFVLNLLSKFDEAKKNSDREQLLEILKECQMDEERALASLEQILNPSAKSPYFKRQSRKLLISYLFIYPLYFVIGMAVSTFILFLMFDWTPEYAVIWFKITALAMGLASYVINWRIGLFAFLDSFGKS